MGCCCLGALGASLRGLEAILCLEGRARGQQGLALRVACVRIVFVKRTDDDRGARVLVSPQRTYSPSPRSCLHAAVYGRSAAAKHCHGSGVAKDGEQRCLAPKDTADSAAANADAMEE